VIEELKTKQMQLGRRSLRSLLFCILLSVLTLTSASFPALAQPDNGNWSTPANISHSNAAANPTVIALPDGTLRVIWWDQFDGLMVADGTLPSNVTASPAQAEAEGAGNNRETWSEPTSAPIILSETVGQETISTPITKMPRIVAGAGGRAHAFWLGNPDKDTGAIPLMYSSLPADSTTWSSPGAIADTAASFDVAAGTAGLLYLAYVSPEQSQNLPAGMHFARSTNGGANWSTPTLVYPSWYLRLLPTEENHMRLTVGDQDNIYVTWDDPRQERVLLAHSADGGESWEEPQAFGASRGESLQSRTIAAPGSPDLLLWYLDDSSQRVVTASTAGDTLTLASWIGEQLLETRKLSFDFIDPDLGGGVHLGNLTAALVPAGSDEGQSAGTLVVVGIDQNNEAWITGSEMAALVQALDSPAGKPPSTTGAQVQDGSPAVENLSRSGTASEPIVVSGSDNTLHAFWWDQFDGLVTADGIVSASSSISGTKEITTMSTTWSEPRPVPLLAATTPRILVDARGTVHAFWLEEPSSEMARTSETGGRPLLHSRLSADEAAWSPPNILSESAVDFAVAADAAGALHLAYIHTQHTPYAPAGIYVRSYGQEGAGWTAPAAIQQSRYVRLLTPDTAHLQVAVDESDQVYVTWDDQHLGYALLAHSPDGGKTWEPPQAIGDTDDRSQQIRLISVPGGETLLLWEATSTGGTCNLRQATAVEALADVGNGGQRVLDGLTNCPDNARFLPLADGQVLMVEGSGGNTLTLAAWDGTRWSEPSRLGFDFEDPDLDRHIYLSDLEMTLVETSATSQGTSRPRALVVVGTDQASDVWATSSQVDVLDLVFAPQPPWSDPASVAETEAFPGLPALAADSEGQLHLLWSEAAAPDDIGLALLYARQDRSNTPDSEDTRWSNPTVVLQPTEGGIEQPALVVAGDRLHAVWRGGENGQVFYSQAFTTDAYVASAWKQPQPLPAPVEMGSWPDIAVGPGGTLHVVYAVPLNEERGIYYTRSEDGEQWSPAQRVFDAAEAGWMMSDHPRLAVDSEGTIHVIWVRATPFAAAGRGQAIYYAQSRDGGQTWSQATEMAAGPYNWPEVIADGAGLVHLFWNATGTEPDWWHRQSSNGGQDWNQPERVPGFEGVSGPVAAVGDGAGSVHLVGLGMDQDGEPALLHESWNGQRWVEPEVFRLDMAMDDYLPGASAALLPALGQMDVVFRGRTGSEGETQQVKLWHAQRIVPTIVATAVPAYTPQPTSTPTAPPAPTVPPTPRPELEGAPPSPAERSVVDILPILVPGALSVLLVAGAFAITLFRARRQR